MGKGREVSEAINEDISFSVSSSADPMDTDRCLLVEEGELEKLDALAVIGMLVVMRSESIYNYIINIATIIKVLPREKFGTEKIQHWIDRLEELVETVRKIIDIISPDERKDDSNKFLYFDALATLEESADKLAEWIEFRLKKNNAGYKCYIVGNKYFLSLVVLYISSVAKSAGAESLNISVDIVDDEYLEKSLKILFGFEMPESNEGSWKNDNMFEFGLKICGRIIERLEGRATLLDSGNGNELSLETFFPLWIPGTSNIYPNK